MGGLVEKQKYTSPKKSTCLIGKLDILLSSSLKEPMQNTNKTSAQVTVWESLSFN